MRLEIHATSDVGLVRSHNEDMALVGKHLVRDGRLDTTHDISDAGRPYVFGVADGLGGQNAGEVASQVVLSCLREDVRSLRSNLAPAVVMREVKDISDEIQRHLVRRGAANQRYQGMSTTLTALLFYERTFFVVHVGDTRCYVFSNGVLRGVTRDHTLREFSGDSRIPGNILSNCFGSQNGFFADIHQLNNEGDKGDVFLLCSDGLSDLVPTETAEAVLRENETMKTSGESLLREAREAGGRDNITFILARIL